MTIAECTNHMAARGHMSTQAVRTLPESPKKQNRSFSFKCDGHHRALHSFPTRRSSDLARPVVGGVEAEPALQALPGHPRAGRPQEPHPEARDRKSTRLNSSHVEISYAVFCLKKKQLHDDTHHRAASDRDDHCGMHEPHGGARPHVDSSRTHASGIAEKAEPELLF